MNKLSLAKLASWEMLKIFKIYVAKLLLAVMLIVGQPAHASALDLSWLEDGIQELFQFLFSTCLQVPNFNSFTTGNIVMDLERSGEWIDVGTSVVGGKMLKLQWGTNGITTKPRKYMIVYRIDPRFTRPQLFIVKYNYSTRQYESDFHRFNNSVLIHHEARGNSALSSRATASNNYFYFQQGRSPISIYPGDVINIALVNMADFMTLSSGRSEFISEITPNSADVASIFTTTGLRDNQILYSDSATWCNYISANPANFTSEARCTTDPATGEELFAGPQSSYNRFVGIMEPVASANILALQSCPANANGSSTNPPCFYDKGRGMKIIAANREIKSTFTPFIHSDLTQKDFFYYKSDGEGILDFLTNIPINNMFLNFPQHMLAWSNNTDFGASAATVGSYLASDKGYVDGMSKYLHLGRYVMMVDIGNNNASFTQRDDITLEYQVLPPGSPTPSNHSPGISVTSHEYTANASQDGHLWLKVTNPHDEMDGNLALSYAYYTGSTFLSNLLYNSVALPIMNMMRDTSQMFYSGIATNPQWQLTVRVLLSLYIIIYGLSFLAGKIQVTVIDVMTRVIKLAVVFAMFSGSSWQFFNQYVFNLFLGGMSYLANSVMGATSSDGNLFGFVDVIFDKYTNPVVWKILFVELLQIQNGMTYLALLMIESIFSYLSAVVEVVICYIMAFLTMCVLISLAPIFLVCMLFERTRGMFDNWMSLLFNYMVQPTVLLVFFLLIDNLMTNQFSEAVMQACWGWLITLNIDLDLSNIGIDYRLRFDLPFLPGIPFYTASLVGMSLTSPFVSVGGELVKIAGAVLMFKIYAQLANGLIEYVTNVVAAIVNVSPGRKVGVFQSATNPTKAIADQLKAPFRAVGGKAKELGKEAGGEMKKAWKNPKRSGASDGG
jgi:type IV secretion system protein VirB6